MSNASRIFARGAHAVNRSLHRASGGRVMGKLRGRLVLLITVAGRKTGTLHTNPVMYLEDHGRLCGDRVPAVWERRLMNAWSSARGGVARHPVLVFMLISLSVGFVTDAPPRSRTRRSCHSTCRCTEWSADRWASASLPSWSRPRCRGALVPQTSDVAACAGGSQCAGT